MENKKTRILVNGKEVEIIEGGKVSDHLYKVRFKEDGREAIVHSSVLKFEVKEEGKETKVMSKQEFDCELVLIAMKLATIYGKAGRIQKRVESGNIVEMLTAVQECFELMGDMIGIVDKQLMLLMEIGETLK